MKISIKNNHANGNLVIPNVCYLFNDITTNVGSKKPGNISYNYLEVFLYNILDITKQNRDLLCE